MAHQDERNSASVLHHANQLASDEQQQQQQVDGAWQQTRPNTNPQRRAQFNNGNAERNYNRPAYNQYPQAQTWRGQRKTSPPRLRRIDLQHVLLSQVVLDAMTAHKQVANDNTTTRATIVVDLRRTPTIEVETE